MRQSYRRLSQRVFHRLPQMIKHPAEKYSIKIPENVWIQMIDWFASKLRLRCYHSITQLTVSGAATSDPEYDADSVRYKPGWFVLAATI